MREREIEMSNVRDRGVIDITLVEGDRNILIILDDMEWNFGLRQQHGRILQDKINDYLSYIASGQAAEARPGLRPVIRILAQYSYSRYCIDFLERVRAFIKKKDDICDIEWTHSPEDGPFEDGFSDDFVFDENKIYPRVKKNWAKDPYKEVSLTAPDESAPDFTDRVIMLRFLDSFIGMFVQDNDTVLTYITYDMLPEGTDVMKLQEKAFENLARDIQYRSCDSTEKGICGIVAGGNFEAESLLINSIWKEISEELGDDLMIVIPTKDVVLYTAAGNKECCGRILEMARDTYEYNRKETPNLLFCRDVFIYSAEDDKIRISNELRY